MITAEIKYDLQVAYGTKYGTEEAAALMECLDNMAPSCGKKVIEFEKAFAKSVGCEFGIAVTSNTTGLTLAGIACGVEEGTEVITTPVSWIATASAFSSLGAKVVFCDIDEKTMCMDANKLEALITDKTKAIIPVHLYGQCAEMDKIMEIAKRHNVKVIEDCAHNPGGSYNGQMAGSIGDIGVFSFHQQKNMSTLGEGGMITTSSKELRDSMISKRSLCCRNYGVSDKYLSIDEDKYPMGKKYWYLQFDDIGYNFRMTDAQACVGLVQLKKLPLHNKIREDLALSLTKKLKDMNANIITPYVDKKGQHTWHLYMVQLPKDSKISKEDFMWQMYTEKGIKAWSHYLPIHLTKPYRDLGHTDGECPVCEEVFNRFVTLPIHPRLTEEAIDYMAKSIVEIVGTK